MAELVTVVGDNPALIAETLEPLRPDVEVQFQGAGFSFKDSLKAEPIPEGIPDPKLPFASRIRWPAKLKNDPKLGTETRVLAARVVGVSATTGKPISGPVRDLLRVQAIDVTSDPKLTRIMFHEFAQAQGAGFVFDPEPARRFLRSLSVQQKLHLCGIAKNNPVDRLVIYVTFYDPAPRDRKIFADDQARRSMRANATFSVFHCRDLAKGGVTLVCHTEHFLVHTGNGHTKAFLESRQYDNRTADEYMQKSNPDPAKFKPVKFAIGANRPAAGLEGHFGVIWSSIFAADGKDIMPGNHLHGMINTHGCWMLFRNYNWPASKRNAFDVIYRRTDRPLVQAGTAEASIRARVLPSLSPHGYDVSGATPETDSYLKFRWFDMNFAHLFFYHEIVGIRYFSKQLRQLPGFRQAEDTMNEVEPHGLAPLRSTFGTAAKGPQFGLQDGDFRYYSLDFGRFPAAGADSLFGVNALGFQAAKGFVGFPTSQLDADALRNRTWADVFFFKENEVSFAKNGPFSSPNAVVAP